MKGNLRVLLKGKLSPKDLSLVYKSYDVIGDIAVIRVPEQLELYKTEIANALMLQHKHVRAVWRQSSPVAGDFRLRKLEWLTGEKRSETIHKEYGCLFKVDIKNCYFSPRLAFERRRIASLVENGEVVVNLFAGVGCYSIIIAKHSKAARIHSIDLNPVAVGYMRENVLLNKVVDRVLPMEGDARMIINKSLTRMADRVLMPLPERAYEYLEVALSTLKNQGGSIHYYDFGHARKEEDVVEKIVAKVGEKLRGEEVCFKTPFGRIVRQTGPNWYQVVIDIKVTG